MHGERWRPRPARATDVAAANTGEVEAKARRSGDRGSAPRSSSGTGEAEGGRAGRPERKEAMRQKTWKGRDVRVTLVMRVGVIDVNSKKQTTGSCRASFCVQRDVCLIV